MLHEWLIPKRTHNFYDIFAIESLTENGDNEDVDHKRDT